MKRIHPVFYILLLEPAPADAQPIKEKIKLLEEEEEYKVDKILDIQKINEKEPRTAGSQAGVPRVVQSILVKGSTDLQLFRTTEK
ncbi:hypothetical protein K432DRAFT_411836 [Lepidopterella palustris CBS 459.81]|uniref:Uncharacterized protein n=1 Tax=Lepidopterella palustris CBS 459.81 TaxID=1314670 RepID=A0A8E2DVW4_9PEZI|nr:hypothetical protein K432DRAFT_411836 [Lepidopterella palustris CBS 459.81]